MALSQPPQSTTSDETVRLLGQIEQVIRWIPRGEAARDDLLRGLAAIEQHVAANALTRGPVLNLQVHVLRLNGSPLRTLLNRRVRELGEHCILSASDERRTA